MLVCKTVESRFLLTYDVYANCACKEESFVFGRYELMASLSLSSRFFLFPFHSFNNLGGCAFVFSIVLRFVYYANLWILLSFTWIPTTPSPIANRVCSSLKKHTWDCTRRLHAIFSLSTKRHYQKSRRRSFPHAFIYFLNFLFSSTTFGTRDTRMNVHKFPNKGIECVFF